MNEPEHVTAARAVYDHSAELYVERIGTTVNPLFETEADLAELNRFAELLVMAKPGPVLDVGCGPGRISAFLAERGLDVSGTDISREMIVAARAAHPRLRFGRGSLQHLPVGDDTLAGAAYWYSIIHSPLDALASVWAESARALRTDGSILVAFQAGDNELHLRENAYGSDSTLTSYRHNVDDVAGSLELAGFHVTRRAVRGPELEHEVAEQAMLTAQLQPARQLDLDLGDS